MSGGKSRFILIALLWVVLLGTGMVWFMRSQRIRIVIAGGPAESETFEICSAIAAVLREAIPEALVEVYETGGSYDNLRLIEDGQVDLTTVQADTEVGGQAQGVAILFSDAYQLIVEEDSPIQGFPDLAGRRIAIAPTNSGQNESFWFLADHYGLEASQLTALPMAEGAADFAMEFDQVDAVFRVRTPGHDDIRDLVEDHGLRIVPIAQAAALALKEPSLSSGFVPKGAYQGDPPIPSEDLPTAVVERLLIARAGLDSDVVQDLTRVLFELRTHLVAETKLAGFIRPLSSSEPLPIPIHRGAQRYYDREKPGFLQRNTRTLSGFLYVVAILTSFFLAMRAKYQRARRVRMGDYNLALMEIADGARRTSSTDTLETLKDQLFDMLREVVGGLDRENVSQDEFEHFRFTWQAVDRLVRDRQAMLPETVGLDPASGPRLAGRDGE